MRRNGQAQVEKALPIEGSTQFMPSLALLKVSLVVSAVHVGPDGLRELSTQPFTVQGADWPNFRIERVLAELSPMIHPPTVAATEQDG